MEVRNAKSIIIKSSKKIKFNFMIKIEVYKKIKIEQLRNETSWLDESKFK